ncbi:hypothetical protein [Bradyrhizobium sp. CCGUVB14]|uniref:hypothetical protein n=1 Tax=Bradyrhizobium sp. CCGUVB14 TaxID=2949628 RepID=UPI0020B2D0BE|nr:hypothetical protein [Bradyrhizobium sp. CCGUVB14]MCP3442253.1 hypothetical protein [Bradyrhizobium sp. CCGUVB14]
MKLLGEYLEHALQFRRMAAEESDPKLKAAMESQAKPEDSREASQERLAGA